MGATVIACASNPAKLAVCREHGADHCIDYAAEDLRGRIKDITGGRGADVVYDPVGGAWSEPAFRSIAWDGRFLVVGFAAGDIPRMPLNLPLLKNASIVGVFYGVWSEREAEQAGRNLDQLFAWNAQGRLRPHISATYPLARAADALNDIAARRVMGKAVLQVG